MSGESTEEKKERYLQGIAKIKESGYTITKASQEFGIPYRTLQRINKNPEKLEKYTGGRYKALTEEQEKELLDFCMDLNKYLVITLSLVRNKAEKTKIYFKASSFWFQVPFSFCFVLFCFVLFLAVFCTSH